MCIRDSSVVIQAFPSPADLCELTRHFLRTAMHQWRSTVPQSPPLSQIEQFMWELSGVVQGVERAEILMHMCRIPEEVDTITREVGILGEAYQQLLSATELPKLLGCLLYTSPSPRDRTRSRMPSSA
eukprot:TRINITY_DN22684_c0_g1_i1.p2 TRINITY_DN22684_c0_g1~~TRINITY_DN22684_c0_g1_i1.p2  ORF type:complete len:127 (+),score=51.04 TRINITY_DN22684_c0_g1_i1:167-547(+)